MRKALFGILVLVTILIYPCPSYEVLSDSQKRSIYDDRGEAGLAEAHGPGGMDPQVKQSNHCSAHSF